MNQKRKGIKRATVVIPKINPSNFEVKLRRDNERLINRLEQLIQIPFRTKSNK